MCVPEIRPMHVLLLGVEEHFPCQAAEFGEAGRLLGCRREKGGGQRRVEEKRKVEAEEVLRRVKGEVQGGVEERERWRPMKWEGRG